MNDESRSIPPQVGEEAKIVREVDGRPVVRDSDDNPVVRFRDLEQAVNRLDRRLLIVGLSLGLMNAANLGGVTKLVDSASVAIVAAPVGPLLQLLQQLF